MIGLRYSFMIMFERKDSFSLQR